MQLFHYHLVSSEYRRLEERYLGKLGFRLVARYGRIGDESTAFEAGVPWDELDRLEFKLRLSQLQCGAVDVVVQPGTWRVPRVDHLGVALSEEGYADVLDRAADRGLRIQERDERRTFVATGAGFRLEVHPPREWLTELLSEREELRVVELQLRADDPAEKADALSELLGLEPSDDTVTIGWTAVRFVPGGPGGRPELEAERFV